jgi:hypothetical protein
MGFSRFGLKFDFPAVAVGGGSTVQAKFKSSQNDMQDKVNYESAKHKLNIAGKPWRAVLKNLLLWSGTESQLPTALLALHKKVKRSRITLARSFVVVAHQDTLR